MRLSPAFTLSLILALLLWGCAQDVYQQRAGAMKTHTRAFYEHLEADRATAAVLENEQIEAMARDIEAGIRRRPHQPGTNQVDRDWMQVKAANETAAENWLSLAKYFVLKKQYDQARGTYQRVLATYNGPTYQTYADRARTGLQDLDMILSPSKGLS